MPTDQQRIAHHLQFHLDGMFKLAMMFHYILVMIQQLLPSDGLHMTKKLGMPIVIQNSNSDHNTTGPSNISVEKTLLLISQDHPILFSQTVNLTHGVEVVS